MNISINIKLLAIALVATLAAGCTTAASEYGYVVEKRYPHGSDKYTQGLQIVDGTMYESTGLYGGESRLMEVDLASGSDKLLATLPADQFGEGITILGDTIYMLTWRENTLYIYDRTSGRVVDTRQYLGEGWGLTSDGEKLYMSNGSSIITVRDRQTFEIIASHSVTLDGEPLRLLNELEWIEGRIWANIYTTDKIAIIDPTTWRVEAMVDLAGLLPAAERTPQTDVLNGIAYDNETKKTYVTGKRWSSLFEIKIIKNR